jgi:hypothetical protein
LRIDDDTGIQSPEVIRKIQRDLATRPGTWLAFSPTADLALSGACALAAARRTLGEHRFGNLMSDLLRFFGGCVFLALAALTATAAPNQLLWKLSVAATEGGHWLAIGALVTAIPWVGQGKLGKLGGFMGLGAAALFALPIFHASQMNQELPAMFDTSFGSSQRTRGRFAEDLRPQPLVMKDLVYSVQSRPVRLEERVFNTADGEKLTLDIFKPGYNHGQPVPGVLVIHGGSWQTGNSRELMALNAYLAACDYIVVAINHGSRPSGSSRRP